MNTSELYVTVGKVLYGGIDPNIPGHGGSECVNYLDRRVMVLDTAVGKRHVVINYVYLKEV